MNHGKKVFLVVDDDGQVRDILSQYLRSFGFENVLQAKNGRGALKIIQNPGQKIDVIIADWEMPQIDGLTLLRAIRKDPERNKIKFIMVSSQSSHERMKITKAAKSHVDAYIVKPFRAQTLRAKLDKILNDEIDESAAEFDARFNITENGPSLVYDLRKLKLNEVIDLMKSYQSFGWIEKSISLANEALGLYPGNIDILYHLGLCHFMQSDYGKSGDFLKQVIALKPDHSEARNLLDEVEEQKSVA